MRKVRKEFKKKMPWWSRELWGMRNRLRSAYNKAKEDLRNSVQSLAVVSYRHLKSEYQRELRRAEQSSFKKFSTDLNENLGAALKAIQTDNLPVGGFPSRLIVNGKELTDPTDILTAFGEHFFPLDPPTEDIHQPIVDAANAATCQGSDTHPPVTLCEIEDAIASLKSSSAPGPDGISAELFQIGPDTTRRRLRDIFDSCLTTRHFPRSWKHARVSIIPKPNKRDYAVPGSYRPISVVNSGSKVFELVLLARLRWLSEGDKWFSSNQHGFLRGKSTETAIHDLVTYIETGMNKKETTAAALLDILKAFDSAWRKAIIATLASRGCPKYLLLIIDSFLSGRTATLSAGDLTFEIIISTGCPQGSVLSAFLWIALIDPALRLNLSFEFRLIAYADDVAVAVSHRDPRIATLRLKSICEAFAEWAKSVKLTISIVKTGYMLFSRRHRSSLEDITLDLFGQKFSPALNAQYLGLLLDWRLTWQDHIEEKCLAAKRLSFMVKRFIGATWGLSGQRLKMIYT